ncbi:hypothetical protein [Nocardia wallacei]|uniref:hypothetical protein n=1 Tax=Nocardia wallacei TaxID=480035 RepID=UPI002458C9D3|nr:hypothetical protein [Nocardia wallacei]
MTLQLWLTTVVAVVGNVTTVVNGILISRLNARNAVGLAITMRDVDRREAHRKEYDDACRDFLVAARRLRALGDRAGTDIIDSTMSDLRSAVARIERYRPELADGTVGTALAAAERLVDLRSHGALSTSVAAAEKDWQSALAEARQGLAADLPKIID